MDRNLWIRLGVIVAVFGVCGYLLWPSYRYFSQYRHLSQEQIAKLPEAERRHLRDMAGKSMKLGLDLQGGMHLVMEMDESKGKIENKADAQDRVLQILQTRVDKFGVTEPTITKQGDSRIMVQLPGIDDPERAHNLIEATAQLEFRLIREPEEVVRVVQKVDEVLKQKAAADKANGVTPSPTTGATPGATPDATTPGATAGAPGDSAHAAADSTFPDFGKESGKPEAPGVSTENPFSSLFVAFQAGALFVPDDGFRVQRINEVLSDPAVRREAIPTDAEFLWSSEEGGRTQDGLPTKMLYMANKRIELKGDHLEDAHVSPDPDRPGNMQINFRLDRRGARTFAKVTEANINKQLAIVLDGVIKSAPNIKSKIPSGEGVIQGRYTDKDARDLAIVLRAGALPVSLRFIEERTVGPTLGSDSLRRGLIASLVGLGLSVLFMVAYYKLSGALAAVALTLNLIVVLAAMAAFGAALSLPGIAGLVLSVAMAVDANVLIFERIREELRKNKTVASAIEAGYKNAFSAILDSNLTTVFAGIVLLYFGTGPVRGFAVTLCIGITASMFTASYVTRFVYDLITRRHKLNSLSI
jgi:protein-export membrane protein SecD